MKYKFTILLEPQEEGGYTITCEELPELVTECDSISEIDGPVQEAFDAIFELYASKRKDIPQKCVDPEERFYIQNFHPRTHPLLRTIYGVNEISRNIETAQRAWL